MRDGKRAVVRAMQDEHGTRKLRENSATIELIHHQPAGTPAAHHVADAQERGFEHHRRDRAPSGELCDGAATERASVSDDSRRVDTWIAARPSCAASKVAVTLSSEGMPVERP